MSENSFVYFGSNQTLILAGTLKGIPALCLKYLEAPLPEAELQAFDHSHIKPESFLVFATKESVVSVCDAMFKLLQMYDEIERVAPLTEDWIETVKDGVL